MARTGAPALSLAASGTIGKIMTFSRWRGRTYIRRRVIPKNPRSGLQTGMRAGARFNSQKYKNLTTTNKSNWVINGKTGNITGLNAMTRFNQRRLRRNLGVVNDPTTTAGAVEAAPTGVAAVAQPKTIVVNWTDSVGASDFCTFVYLSITTGFTPDISNLYAIVPHGTQTQTITKLVTGTPYYVVVQGCENGGTRGTAAAQVTATPT